MARERGVQALPSKARDGLLCCFRSTRARSSKCRKIASLQPEPDAAADALAKLSSGTCGGVPLTSVLKAPSRL